MKIYFLLSCLVSALLSVSVHSIRRIDRHPAHVQPGRPRGLLSNPIRDIFRFVSRRRSQNGNKRFYQPKQKGLVSPGPKEKRGLIPITLPNFIYLDAEQMPGYEKFEKHEIVRNGKTTESPYFVEYIESIQDYTNLVDERTPSKKL